MYLSLSLAFSRGCFFLEQIDEGSAERGIRSFSIHLGEFKSARGTARRSAAPNARIPTSKFLRQSSGKIAEYFQIINNHFRLPPSDRFANNRARRHTATGNEIQVTSILA